MRIPFFRRGPAETRNLERWKATDWPRLWVEVRRGTWDHAGWLELLDQLQRSRYWPLRPEEVGAVLEEHRQRWLREPHPEPAKTLPEKQADNLRRWLASGLAERWIEAKSGYWDHPAWLDLAWDLRTSIYWPLDLDAVGAALEALKVRWREAHARPAAPVTAELPTAAALDPVALFVAALGPGQYFVITIEEPAIEIAQAQAQAIVHQGLCRDRSRRLFDAGRGRAILVVGEITDSRGASVEAAVGRIPTARIHLSGTKPG